MATYYDVLRVQPTASAAEIEAAYETLYTQWRRLATHHDPNTVNQANQNLQVLESIRTTLADPSKRAAYDAGLGLGGAVGGLADLDALPRMAPGPVAPPAPPVPGGVAPAAPSLWACPKCKVDNPAQTAHCLACGTQLVRECPHCVTMTSLVNTGFCGTCGYRHEAAMRLRELRDNIERKRASLDEFRRSLISAEQKINENKGANTVAMIVGGIVAFVVANALLGELIYQGRQIIPIIAAGALTLALAVWVSETRQPPPSTDLRSRLVEFPRKAVSETTWKRLLFFGETMFPRYRYLGTVLLIVAGLVIFLLSAALIGLLLRQLWQLVAFLCAAAITAAFVLWLKLRQPFDGGGHRHQAQEAARQIAIAERELLALEQAREQVARDKGS